MTVLQSISDAHLDALEAESIYILRELAAERESPVLLFSGGKDSTVLLHLAQKAFWPGKLPFPLLHVDTGHNFPEVIEFRDHAVRHYEAKLIIRQVQDAIDQGRVTLASPLASRNAAQSVTLLDAIREFNFDAAIGGARRDEEKARAKERIFSVRGKNGGWDPKSQRPELWDLYNSDIAPGEHLRVFPISNWTELDIWQYIAREQIKLPTLYFSHQREVVRHQQSVVAVTELTPAQPGQMIELQSVRFRTVGDITCTAPVLSQATDIDAIIRETISARMTERGATRLDDAANEASMELRKKEGYF
jgi:sulfate adenylyltransferase subunit 2